MIIKRLVRWTGVLFAALLLLPTAATLMLYVAPLQDAAVRWASAWFTQQTGMEVRVESLRVRFPLRIRVDGFQVGTLLGTESIETHIRLRPLLRGVVEADIVSARGISVHTGTRDETMLTGLTVRRLRMANASYHWRERKAHLGDVFIADGYITLQGYVGSSLEKSGGGKLPLSLSASKIGLQRIGISYAKNKMLLHGFAGETTLHDMAVDTVFRASLQSIKIADGAITFKQDGKDPWELTKLTARADSLHYSPASAVGRLTQLAFEESHGIVLREATAALAWEDGILSMPQFALRTGHSTLNGHLHTLGRNTSGTTINGDAHIRIGYTDVLLLAKRTEAIPEEMLRLYPTETFSASFTLDGTTERLQLIQCAVSLPTAFDIKMNGTVQGITDPKRCEVWGQIELRTHDMDFLTTFVDSTTSTRIAIPHNIVCYSNVHYAPDTLHTQCTLILNKGKANLEAGYHLANRAYTLQIQTDSLDLRQILPEKELGQVSLHAHLAGNNFDYMRDETSIYGALRLHSLQWAKHTFSNATVQMTLANKQFYANASYGDSLMQWSLKTTIKYTPETIVARLYTQLDDLNMKALQLADTDIRPILRCQTSLRIDSATTYTLHSRFSDIVLSTATQTIRPKTLVLNATLTPDTVLLGIRSGDLTLNANAHIEGLPWQWEHPTTLSDNKSPGYLSALHATLSAESDNPISNYLSLLGIKYHTLHATLSEHRGNITSHLAASDISAKGFATDTVQLTAHYTNRTLHTHLHTGTLTWITPQMQFQGKANATLRWGSTFAPDSLSGLLSLSSVQYTLPTYNLQLHTVDTLSIPIERGGITLTALPLYTTGKRPLLLDGHIALWSTPSLQLCLTAHDTDILRAESTRETLLYGKALISGNVTLSGPFNALVISGNLRLRPGSSIHYIHRNAILTANNQLDNVVTFINFDADSTTVSRPKRHLSTNGISMNLNLAIDPTAQLEVSLGASQQNTVTLQGGGTLNLQYIPAGGLRLSGQYTIEGGELNMNVPLLHANHMSLRSGSTVTWSGNPQNPQLDIAAEERIRASVSIDGSPQSVLFITSLSLTDTVEKLGLQFTLSAPENASMQNTLAALSAEERSKLAVALLTTGLYLGEGGTGKLMNTALMSILQSQLDNISRDAFRTVDVSVGIEPLPDGVSGISTRTDYSFSLAKRFWNDRIRIIIGGSVTTSNERIEDDAIIDNISIEWRINPIGNQYLRFFYDKNYESILEGEIRETGIGYAYRRRF